MHDSPPAPSVGHSPDIHRMAGVLGRDCTPTRASARAGRDHERLGRQRRVTRGMVRAGKSELAFIKAQRQQVLDLDRCLELLERQDSLPAWPGRSRADRGRRQGPAVGALRRPAGYLRYSANVPTSGTEHDLLFRIGRRRAAAGLLLHRLDWRCHRSCTGANYRQPCDHNRLGCDWRIGCGAAGQHDDRSCGKNKRYAVHGRDPHRPSSSNSTTESPSGGSAARSSGNRRPASECSGQGYC